MDRYGQLKAKWMELAGGEWPDAVFDPDLLGPGKFLMYIADEASDGLTECAAYFDSVHDGLAFLRFIQIPVVLDNDTIKSHEIKPAEDYLAKYAGDRRAGLEALLAGLDALLKSDGIIPGAMARVMEQYDACFADTDPQSRIVAWGNMTQVLASPYLWDKATEQLEDVEDQEFEVLDALKELLDSGKFNEKSDRHVRLAGEFFEMVMVG